MGPVFWESGVGGVNFFCFPAYTVVIQRMAGRAKPLNSKGLRIVSHRFGSPVERRIGAMVWLQAEIPYRQEPQVVAEGLMQT